MGAPEATSGNDENGFNDSAQPLLDKSHDFSGGELEDQVVVTVPPAAEPTQFTYNHGPRPCRDLIFAIIFLLAVAAVVVFGIFAIVHHNPEYSLIGSARYNNKTCSIVRDEGKKSLPWTDFGVEWNGRKWVTQEEPFSHSFDVPRRKKLATILHLEKEGAQKVSKLITFKLRMKNFAASNKDPGSILLLTLGVTLVLCIPMILGLLWLLKSWTKELVYVCVPLVVLIPLVLDIAWFVICLKDNSCHDHIDPAMQIGIFLFVIVLCGIFAWILYANWDRVELTIKIIRTASEALRSNLSLLFILPSLTVVLLILLVPIVAFMVYAYMNGRLVPNPVLEQQPSLPCGKGYTQDCCVWKTEAWVPAYQVLTALIVLWLAMVIGQVQSFTISGTISQWYFAELESSTRGFIKRSLGHAFGPSFGTCCFSGFVFAFTRVIRWVADSVEGNRVQQGAIVSLFRSCLGCILQGIEFVNKFTLNFASITGEGYCASAVLTSNLLRRNLLSTVFVEIISSRLLGAIVLVVSLVYAAVVFALLHVFANIGSQSYLVTLIAWALLFFILVLLIGVLNAVIDTVYICYSMDKDQGKVSKSQVHDVYVLLPLSQNGIASLAVRHESV